VNLLKLDTLKSKTFWGLVAMGVIYIARWDGAIDANQYEHAMGIAQWVAGVSAVDRLSKILAALKQAAQK
jgi:hypothetical protein